ncbi:response regulator [uncultured Sphaerochaeta sp.]|uniref:response regulator transcription factor n=1 Tax=uncultured Sphaerochaeta sp. TaxID=886478 RepID=UPI002A0A6640|nr:response regulator [uncultured Sphaerochaeta sp.]
MYQIVLLDDEVNILEGLENHFPWSEFGFEIAKTFNYASAALEFLAQNPIELVITDIKMPNMDGIEFVKELRRRKIPTLVILLSGYADFSYAKKAISYGVKEYLLKPLDREALSLTLTKIKEELDRINYPERESEKYNGYYKQITETIKTYVSREYAHATLDEAALLVALSPNYVSKLFKSETDQKFSDYLLEVKMKKAVSLLQDVNLRIYEISFAVGYDNPKNFTRAFKQYFGKTPWEYREAGI